MCSGSAGPVSSRAMPSECPGLAARGENTCTEGITNSHGLPSGKGSLSHQVQQASTCRGPREAPGKEGLGPGNQVTCWGLWLEALTGTDTRVQGLGRVLVTGSEEGELGGHRESLGEQNTRPFPSGSGQQRAEVPWKGPQLFSAGPADPEALCLVPGPHSPHSPAPRHTPSPSLWAPDLVSLP